MTYHSFALAIFMVTTSFLAASVASQPLEQDGISQEELDAFVAECAISGQGAFEVEPFLTYEGQPRLRLSTSSPGAAAAMSCFSDSGAQSLTFEYKATLSTSATGRLKIFHPGPDACIADRDIATTNDVWVSITHPVPCAEGREVGFLLLHGDQPGSNEVTFNLDSFEEFWDLFKGTTATPIEAGPAELPDSATLLPAYPNPFNPSTTIRYAVEVPGRISITVYDALGRKVATLVDEVVTAGEHSVVFDAADLPSGVNLVRLVAKGVADAQRVTLLR